MKIAANLGVKDEAEMVESVIRHLERIGVDHVIACDMSSTDGTWDILKRHQSSCFELLQIENADSVEHWEASNIRMIREARADWVIFLDADEYWLPATGNLRDIAALENADVIRVDRFNVALGPDGPCIPSDPSPDNYSEIQLFTKPVPNLARKLEEDETTAWIRGIPVPKVMARPQYIDALAAGMHDVFHTGPDSPRRAQAEDMVIAHVPFSSYARFQRKIENVRDVLGHHAEYFSGSKGWHWKRWVARADQGRLHEEFSKQVLDHKQLLTDRALGNIQTARESLAGLDCTV